MMEKPTWNKDLNDWEVCGECLEIIFSLLDDVPEQDDEEVYDEEVEDAFIDAYLAIKKDEKSRE